MIVKNLYRRIFFLALLTPFLLSLTRVATAQQMRIGIANQCPVVPIEQKEMFPLAALAAPIVADVAARLTTALIDKLAVALTEKDIFSRQAVARIDALLEKNDKQEIIIASKTKCVVIVVADEFGEKLLESESKKSFFPDTTLGTATNKIWKLTKLRSGLSFYMEAQLVTSSDGTAISIKPKYWYYPRFVHSAGWWFADKRDIMLRLELSLPGQSDPFGAFEVKWDAIRNGAIADLDLAAPEFLWGKLPAEAVTAGENQEKAFLPINMKAQLVETAQPNVLARVIGETLSAKKAEIGTTVGDTVKLALSREVRYTAKSQLLTDIETKLTAYEAAFTNATAAYSSWQSANASDKPTALLKAQIAYAKEEMARKTLKTAWNSTLGPIPDFPQLSSLK